MKKTLLFLFVFLILFAVNIILTRFLIKKNNRNILTQKVLNEISKNSDNSSQFRFSAAPFVLGAYQANVNLVDGRVANLKNFFRKYNSVLFDHAEKIVEVSDNYQFDYRLLPAIAMQESNLCKYIPADSFNCWGWGIYGNTVTKFDSYDESIETVAKGIKKEYIDKGLITASSIMEKYTPSSQGSWAHGVNTFLKDLE